MVDESHGSLSRFVGKRVARFEFVRVPSVPLQGQVEVRRGWRWLELGEGTCHGARELAPGQQHAGPGWEREAAAF